jgi:hypothetical protein
MIKMNSEQLLDEVEKIETSKRLDAKLRRMKKKEHIWSSKKFLQSLAKW